MTFLKRLYDDYKLIFKIFFIHLGKRKNPVEILRKQQNEFYKNRVALIKKLECKYKSEYVNELMESKYSADEIEEQLKLFGDRFYRKARISVYDFENLDNNKFHSKLKDDINRLRSMSLQQIMLYLLPFYILVFGFTYLLTNIYSLVIHYFITH